MASVGFADVGDLDALGCVEDSGGVVCATTAPGLQGAIATAISPDGDNAYVAAFYDDALVTFTRNPDGTLVTTGCFQNTGGSECDGTGGDLAALDGAADVVVSPDGSSVYVVSNGPSAILMFSRDGGTGALTSQGCIQDSSSSSQCAGTGGTTPGMRQANAVAISPDGKNVYVASFLSDGVAWFSRNLDGTLEPEGCIQNTGRTECASLGGNAAGLDGAYDVAVSDDGKNVYVASYLSDAVVVFDRALDGSLTATGCVQNPGIAICASSFDGLAGPRSVAVSSDGASVYVGSFDDDAIVTFDRAGDGSLTAVSCIQNTGGSDCTGSGGTTPGLDGISSTTVSPDGKSVYAASLTSDAAVAFDRASNGALTPAGCVQNTGRTECTTAGGSTTAGLDGAIDVTTSPLGDNLYVASLTSSAVVVFGRELPGTTTTTNTTTTTLGPPTTTTMGPETTTTTLPATTTTTVPETTTTTLPVTTTTVPETTTTTVAPETTTTTVIEPTTTTVPDTTTTLPPPPTTTTLPEPTTTTTIVEPTTTTLAPETTTTTLVAETTTTTAAPETTTTTLAAPTTTTTEEPPICGDVNDSGEVTAIDALAVLRASVGGDECDAFPCACDAAGGGTINATDALRTLQRAVGLAVIMACPC